jgi:Right handed beta helix region
MTVLRVMLLVSVLGGCEPEGDPPFAGETSQAVASCDVNSTGWPCSDNNNCTVEQCVDGQCLQELVEVCGPEPRHWYVSPVGTATGNGSKTSPWSLEHASTCAGGMIQPGDIVNLASGTYRGTYEMRCSGTQTQPIRYVAAVRHRAVIDTAIPEFVKPRTGTWEPYSITATRHVYRSTTTFAYPNNYHFVGFIKLPTGPLTLIVHGQQSASGGTGLAHLMSDEHLWKPEPTPRYVGPGVAFNSADGRIYIRLDRSTPTAQRNRTVAYPPNVDPRANAIYLAPITSNGLAVKASHVVFDGLTVATAAAAINTGFPGVDDVVFKNMKIRPGYFGARLGWATNVQILDSTFDAHMPSSIFSASEMDIKGAAAPPADNTRKLGLDLGLASNVTISGNVFNEFHDGILSQNNAHHIKLLNNTFRGTWDDAWQMFYGVHHVEIAYNKFLGAGVSRDSTGSATSVAPNQGTVWIHHNVFDPTQNQIWWYRGGPDVVVPPNVGADGMIDGIPLSSHGGFTDTFYGFPYKLYYNTFMVAEPKDQSVSIGTIGEYGNLAASGSQLVPTRFDGAPHEVYNNIFVDKSNQTPSPTYWITGQVIGGVLKGREMYDGNVFSGWSPTTGQPIYRYIRKSNGALNASPDGQGIKTPELLRTYNDIVLETSSYRIPSFGTAMNGWEHRGFSTPTWVTFDPCYRPTNCPNCTTNAVSLVGSGWPGTSTYQASRGAVAAGDCL